MSGIDKTELKDAALIRSITNDGETTVLRTAQEIREMDDLLRQKEQSCGGRPGLMRTVFGMRLRSQNYPSS